MEPLRARRLPMLLAAGCFAAGIALAHAGWRTPVELLFAAGVLLFLTLLAQSRAPRLAGLPVLAFWIAVGCWCAQMQPPLPRQTNLLAYADGLSRVVRGTVTQVRTLQTSDGNPDAPQQAAEPWLIEPGAWEPEGLSRASVDLQVSAVEDITPDVSALRALSGGVRASLPGEDASALRCGDIVEIPLRLRTPDTYRDPGAWSYADFLLESGIGALGSAGTASHPTHLRMIGHQHGNLRCRLHSTQDWGSARLDALVRSPAAQHLPPALRLTPEDAAMLSAMLFGNRQRLTRTLRTGFERTGTFHLFVVSGLHVALLAGGLLWLLRRFRLPYAPAVVLSLSTATAYALLTGWGVPVQRALGMTALYMVARLFARDTTPLNALGAAALAVLVWDPRALFTASFVMTFLVIFAIAGLAAPLHDRTAGRLRLALRELPVLRLDAWLPPRLAELRVRLRLWGELLAAFLAPVPLQAGNDAGQAIGRAAGWLARALAALPAMALRLFTAFAAALIAALVAECCMVLPMAVYFHRATPWALSTNLLCLPLIGVLLCAAIATFALSLLSLKLALVPAATTAGLLHALRFIVEHTGHSASADLRVPAPAALSLVLAAAALLLALYALRAPRRWLQATGIAALILAGGLALWPTRPLLHPGVLEVTALDVGQGDSLLVVSPEGRTLLIDGGGPVGQNLAARANSASSEDRWDIGEEVVAPYLWSRRIRRLDAVLLTHAHSDHMGGLPAILRDLRPRELWLGAAPGRAPGLEALRAEAVSLGIALRFFHAGDAFPWGGVHAEVLAPEPEYANPGEAVNDDSLVLRLAYGAASVLLEGDAQSRSEQAMLAHNRVTASTLLKVSHHGSRTSTTPEFLQAVAPRDAVISVGSHNTFGHPRPEVLQRLEAAGVRTYRTDRAGAETFLLTADGSLTAQLAR